MQEMKYLGLIITTTFAYFGVALMDYFWSALAYLGILALTRLN